MPPAGAAAEMVSVTLTDLWALTLIEPGVNVPVTVTETLAVSGANPVAVALICAEPIAPPVTCGFAEGMSKPAGTKTLGVTVATVAFVLVKLIVRPPVGAAKERLTGRLALCPGPRTGIVPKLMRLPVTANGAVAVMYPVAVAVNDRLPLVAPAVTENTAVVCPAAMVWLAGEIVTRPLGLAERPTVTPPAPAG